MINKLNLKKLIFFPGLINIQINYINITKIFLIAFAIVFFGLSFSEAKKKEKEEEKDCLYCNQYEMLKEWPESERPEAFII